MIWGSNNPGTLPWPLYNDLLHPPTVDYHIPTMMVLSSDKLSSQQAPWRGPLNPPMHENQDFLTGRVKHLEARDRSVRRCRSTCLA